jgi:hypothetical protein
MNSSAKNWLWLALGVVACAVSWTYMHRVLLPWEHYVNVTHGNVKEQMGDLYPRWVGTRELLSNGRNPYSVEVSHEIQMAFYGHAIEQSYDKPESEIVDEQRFVYPVYVVFLLAPTVHADFAQLQEWTPIVLGALVAASVWLWMGAVGWKPPPVLAAAIVLFVLSSPQVAQGLRLRQFGLFVAFLLALASWCAIREQFVAAGILLALSTIKPQMVALCLVWFLIWSIGDWKKRWTLTAGLFGGLGVLVGAGEWLVPGWPRFFLAGLDAYRKYFPSTSPVRLLLGNFLGGAVSVLAVISLLAFAWSRRKAGADSAEFRQTLALFLVTTTLVLPLLTPYNQGLLLLPVMMLIREWRTLPRAGRWIFVFLVAWPLAASSVMVVRPPQVESLQRAPLLPSAILLLLPFLLLWFLLVRTPVQTS